jgi:hypothetical protein
MLSSVAIELNAVLVCLEHWWDVLCSVAVSVLCTRTITRHRVFPGHCYTDGGGPTKSSLSEPGVREGVASL